MDSLQTRNFKIPLNRCPPRPFSEIRNPLNESELHLENIYNESDDVFSANLSLNFFTLAIKGASAQILSPCRRDYLVSYVYIYTHMDNKAK